MGNSNSQYFQGLATSDPGACSIPCSAHDCHSTEHSPPSSLAFLLEHLQQKGHFLPFPDELTRLTKPLWDQAMHANPLPANSSCVYIACCVQGGVLA